MKAIETVYNGYRFRSRLEARWAVFFDTLQWKYEYEPEGYQFEDGTRYLPDFWLPDHGLFVEIKPQPDLTEDEDRKAKLLWRGSGKPVIVFCGPPWDVPMTYLMADPPFGLLKLFVSMVVHHCDVAKQAAQSSRFEYGENGAPA